MVVLGFILVVAAVLVGVGAGTSSTSSASIEGYGLDVDADAALVFAAGAATAIVLLAGLWLMAKGTSRTYRRRQQVKALQQQAEATRSTETGTAPVEPDDAREGRHAAPPNDEAHLQKH